MLSVGKELGLTFGDSAGELAAGVVNMAAVGGVPIGEGRGPGLGFGLGGGVGGGGGGDEHCMEVLQLQVCRGLIT